MIDAYKYMDNIVKKEIEGDRKIAIYPLGKFGLLAKDIIENRYGINPILIDNYVYKYNKRVLSFDQFLKRNDLNNITILVATKNMKINSIIESELEEHGLVKRNILRPFTEDCSGIKDHLIKIKEMCMVYLPIGYCIRRIGCKNDGGYCMIDDFFKGQIAYSVGIDRNVSWDEQMAEYGLEVYCYDHTIDNIPTDNKHIHFYKKGIAGYDDNDHRLFKLETLLKSNHHLNENNMILKMDVEGAEWDVIENTPSEILDKFSQITLELHRLYDTELIKRIAVCLEKISMTHKAVWIHGNNAGNVGVVDGISIPYFLEITFANKKRYQFEKTDYSCPIYSDFPNLDNYYDIELPNWNVV